MKFLKRFTLSSVILLSSIQLAMAAPTTGADTIFYGGPILTVNAKNEQVQALAIQGEKLSLLEVKRMF